MNFINQINIDTANDWMNIALVEANLASTLGEVPVGAIAIHENKIIARAHNEVETKKDATAHAEMLVMQRASALLGSWRLNEVSIVVTLEPCTMCIGAMILSRVKELYFGCYDERQGAVGSVYDLSRLTSLPHQLKVYPEILKDQCAEPLKRFFRESLAKK
jgi:tRNA(adenine34) deaminase